MTKARKLSPKCVSIDSFLSLFNCFHDLAVAAMLEVVRGGLHSWVAMRKTKLPIIRKCFVSIFKMLFDHLSFQIISKNSFDYLLQLEIENHTDLIYL